MELGWISIVVQLIFLEGILSIDNAAVLGAMVAPLPADQPIPWPSWLRGVGRALDPLLGAQQQAALKVGLIGAYVGRALMLFIASFIVQNPWLRLLGGAYLIYLAMSHLTQHSVDKEGEEQTGHTTNTNFWSVVLAVELADLAFSLDNVVAAVALSDELWVVLLGVALGIVTMRFAAGLFATLVKQMPILEPTAYVLVFLIGSLLVLEDLFHVHVPEAVRFSLSFGTLGIAVLLHRYPALQAQLRPLWLGFERLLEVGMWVVNLFLRPLGALAGSMRRKA